MNCRDSPNIGSPICPGGRFSVQSLPEFCVIILYKSTPTTKIKTNSNIFFLFVYRNDVYFLVECIESGGLKRATLIAYHRITRMST